MTDVKRDLVSRFLDDPKVRREMEHEWFFDKIVVQIEAKLTEKKISRTDLAERLSCSPSNVTQLLREGSNITVRKLMDIALAIDHRFLAPELVPLTGTVPWETCSVHIPMSAPVWISEGDATTYALAASDEYQATRAQVVPYDMQRRCESHGQ